MSALSDAGAAFQHTTVLLTEAVEALVTRADGTYVDGTFGRGGHSRAVLQRLSPAGRLVALTRTRKPLPLRRPWTIRALPSCTTAFPPWSRP